MTVTPPNTLSRISMKLQKILSMRMPLLISLLLAISTVSSADDSTIQQGTKTQASQGISKQYIRGLSSAICMSFARDGNKVAKKVKNLIVEYMQKHEKVKDPTVPQIVKFLNTNKNYMTCGEKNHNYMMMAFKNGRAYDQLFNVLYFDEFLVDENLFVDVNAFSYTGGQSGKEPETVLDFMYKQYSDSNNPQGYLREVKELIDFFERDLGAKRYAQLAN